MNVTRDGCFQHTHPTPHLLLYVWAMHVMSNINATHTHTHARTALAPLAKTWGGIGARKNFRSFLSVIPAKNGGKDSGKTPKQ